MASLGEANRMLSITSSLGDDVLLLKAFQGEEQCSQPFQFYLDLMSETTSIDPTKLVGTAVTFSVKLPDDTFRYYNGYVRRLAAGPVFEQEELKLRSYRAEVVPWLWFLSMNNNCRVFQEKSIPDIIEQVCKDAGKTDYKLSLKGTYAKLEYCVQYRESDLAFISRLMEQAGIFYYATHDKSKHTIVLGDQASSYVDCVESQVEFFSEFDGQLWGQVTDWNHNYELIAGKYTHTDYNYETADTNLLVSEKTVVKLKGISDVEFYDYPGLYGKTADGKTLAVVRMEQIETPYEVVQGTSHCATFVPGSKFKIKTHPVADEQNQQYALISVAHDAQEPAFFLSTYEEKGAEKQRPEYTNSFRCIPAKTPYRSPLTIPVPVIRGPQTAKVVGAKNQELYTDKYGRIKIQFPWDREGQFDDKSSCWVRVAQSIAGKQFGGQYIPRVGHEVLVNFLEGNPDRPLVTGSVYNSDNMTPYDLPDKQYISGYKTQSGDKGKAKNYNELFFDDTIGKEQISIHAERDYIRYVENNDQLKVGYDVKDAGDQTIDIYNNRTVTLDKGNDTLTIKTGDNTLNIDKGNHAITVKQGDQTISIKAGQQTTEAAKSITLKVGGNSIVINSQGVTIKGTNITIDGQAGVKIKGGSMAEVTGGGMLTLKGGLVKIN